MHDRIRSFLDADRVRFEAVFPRVGAADRSEYGGCILKGYHNCFVCGTRFVDGDEETLPQEFDNQCGWVGWMLSCAYRQEVEIWCKWLRWNSVKTLKSMVDVPHSLPVQISEILLLPCCLSRSFNLIRTNGYLQIREKAAMVASNLPFVSSILFCHSILFTAIYFNSDGFFVGLKKAASSIFAMSLNPIRFRFCQQH